MNSLYILCLLISILHGFEISFPFGIHLLKKTDACRNYFCAAHPFFANLGIIKNHSLIKINELDHTFISVVPEKVTINIVNHQQPNPLYDDGIRDLAFITAENSDLPVVLRASDSQRVYVFESLASGSLLMSDIVQDSQGSNAMRVDALAVSRDGLVFVVVTPATGFGNQGSGIAMLVRGNITQDSLNQRIFVQLSLNRNFVTGSSSFPFDKASDVFIFNQVPLDNLETPVSCFDNQLHLLYVGFTATSSSTLADGGAKGICIFNANSQIPQLKSLADDLVFQGRDDLLIVTHAQGGSVAIHDIVVMHTSTGLDYLIVSCGVESRQLRVFPLVADNSVAHGQIAAKNSTIGVLELQTPQNIFFQKRFFNQAAQSSVDLFEVDDAPVLIGNNKTQSLFLLERMQKMFVQGDTVFIVVRDDSDQSINGLYSSKAIFDDQGRVDAWSEWRRELVDPALLEVVPSGKQGGFLKLHGTSANEIFNLSLDEWRPGESSTLHDAQKEIQDHLLRGMYSLSSFKNFIDNDQRAGNSLCLTAASYGRFLLRQIGVISNQGLSLNSSAPSLVVTVNESTDSLPSGATTLVFDGLEDLGFITDVTTVHHALNNQEFLVCAGTKGAAILIDADGGSWSKVTGIGNHFEHLKAPVAWQVLATDRCIKKIISDDHFLYLLSDTFVERIDIHSFDTTLEKTIIANADSFSQGISFVDFIPSGQYGVLATTNGIFSNKELSNITTDMNLEWHEAWLPESVHSIQKVIVTKADARVNLDVLCSNKATQQATVVKMVFFDGKLILCDNQRINRRRTHFLNYGLYMKDVYTNGAWWYGLIQQDNQQSWLAPALVGFVSPESNTPFLGLMPAVIARFTELKEWRARHLLCLSTGKMIVASNTDLYVIE